MNPLISMGFNPPNPVAAYTGGVEAKGIVDDRQNQNALRGYIQQNGAGIMSGDQNALAGLGGMGPQGLEMAMGVQNQQLNQQATRQGMENDKARLGLAFQQAERQGRQFAAQMSAAEAEQSAAELRQVAEGGLFAAKQGEESLRAYLSMPQVAEGLASAGINPADITTQNIDQIAVGALGVSAGLVAGMQPEPYKPLSDEGKALSDRQNMPGLAEAPMPADVEGETKLRKEYDDITKDFRDVSDAFRRISASDRTTPQGHMALIFNFMKMLDPGSTVREGEFATAEQTGGIPTWIRNQYNKAVSGDLLDGKQIDQFMAQAKDLYDGALMDADATGERYKGLASEYGFNPDRIVSGYGAGFGESEAPPDVPPELLEQLKGQPPGTQVKGPNGQTLTWDGQKLQ